ncbi:MAG TPA: FkbM family methyltransferase [Candidatus Nanopusillus sp.]|nr:FkbM family methyltransferase [Candidatus Nanopusillus sp.]
MWKNVDGISSKFIFPIYSMVIYLYAKIFKKENGHEYILQHIWAGLNYKVRYKGFTFISEKSLVSTHILPYYEKETIEVLMNIRGKIFIDVGAHVGRYSILLSKNFEKIIAIEPDPYNFSYLVKHICINKLEDKVLPINIALADRISFLKLYLSEEGDGKHSLVVPKERYIPVLTLPLDFIIGQLKISYKDISLIKIDVEGAEYMVLKGMEKVLKEGNPIVVIEIWYDNPNKERAIKLLEEKGYKIIMKLDNNDTFANYVFAKER